MGWKTPLEALQALIQAYYIERNVEKVLDCVMDDILWVGMEKGDTARGKEELRVLLQQDVDEFPRAIGVQPDKPEVIQLGEDSVLISTTGHQIAACDQICELEVRSTVTVVRTEEGWRLKSCHTSVPNAELEKFILAHELDEVRKKEETLMRSIPGGVATYHVKKNGNVMTEYISEGLAGLYGYTVQEFQNLIRSDALKNIVEEDREDVIEIIRTSLEQKMPINVIYRVYDKAHRPIRIRMDANVISEGQLPEDEIATLYAVHTKVSREREKILSEQNRYRDILNTLGIAYFELGEDRKIYTSEKYREYALSEVDNSTVMANSAPLDMVYEEDLPKLFRFFRMAEKHQPKISVTLRLKMRDGSYRWTEMTGFFKYNEMGERIKTLGILRDCDSEWEQQNRKLKKALESAQKANQAKTDFLSRVSHDMRTPLNGILGLTELLAENTTDPKVRQDLIHMELSGKYLLNLINDTLDVNKIESGKLELNPVVCDGRTVFNNVLALLKPQLSEKNIELEVDAENLPFNTLYIDVGRVEQIVMNVLGNAIKFTPEGGRIYFKIENIAVDHTMILDRVTIEDNGVGMSEEFIPHLFEPFSQEHSGSTSEYKGTGLGMAITREIIELMGGEISVESMIGKGTKFTFTLPMPVATEEQKASWRAAQCMDSSARTLKGKRVLLCEDHPLNATIASRLMVKKGVLVDHAENGRAGVEMFRASSPNYYDMILMDIRMPEMDGIEATRLIRRLHRSDAQRIPIIAMTANAFYEDEKQALNAGMDAHLAKPIDTVKLYSTLEYFMQAEPSYIRKKILVVDDIVLNRSIIVESIKEDYDTIEASNGQEALDILQREAGIDAVITDIQMPHMDGRELIKKIRADRDYNHIAILANTQYGDVDQEEELLSIGADDFLYKPTKPKIIKFRLDNILKD